MPPDEAMTGSRAFRGEHQAKPLKFDPAELKDLQALQPDLRQRGVSVIEVLVDPVETPDTVDAARQQLARNPLPFPVVMMVPALRDVFGYEGFPATYFVKADGTFSTTLFG